MILERSEVTHISPSSSVCVTKHVSKGDLYTVRLGKDVIALVTGSAKYIIKLSEVSKEILSQCNNVIVKDVLRNGIEVSYKQLKSYVEHYV